MLSLLNAYIKNIVVLLIFSVFTEMLLPDNRFRGYINIVTGVVLIAVILNPIAGILNSGEFDFYDVLAQKEAEIYKLEYKDGEENVVFKLYEENLEQKIKGILEKDGIDVSSVAVSTEYDTKSEFYGGITEVNVFISGDESLSVFGTTKPDTDLSKNVTSSLEKIPQISPECIKVFYN